MAKIELLSRQDWEMITPQELRNYMRMDDGETEDVLGYYLRIAINLFENMTHHILQKSHYRYTMPFTTSKVFLLHSPVIDIVSVKIGGALLLPEEYSWDGLHLHLDSYGKSPLEIEYIAGYPSVLAVEIYLKHILMMCAADLYYYRLESDEDPHRFSKRLMRLIGAFRKVRI